MRTWQRSHPGWVSFVEVLLCFLVVIMPIVSMLKNKGVETKAEYVITAEWSILDTDPDVDLWAMPPGGLPVFYRNRQVGLTFLDQDCLGKSNSTAVQADGTTVALNVCKETITLRGIVAGRYDLALNLYSYRDGAHTVVEKSDSLDVQGPRRDHRRQSTIQNPLSKRPGADPHASERSIGPVSPWTI